MTPVPSAKWWIALIGFSSLYFFDRQLANLLAIVAIAVGGIPHGAADMLKIGKVFPGKKINALALVAYLLLAGLMVWLFLAWTTIGLWFFIIISLWHFGETDCGDLPNWAAWFLGGLPIFLPFVLWQDTIAEALTLLGMIHSNVLLTISIARYAAMLSIIGVLLACFNPAKGRLRRAGLLCLIALPSLLLPPLLGFVLYFVFIHAPRHSVLLERDFPNWHFRPSVWIATAIPLALAILWILTGGAQVINQDLIRVLVIGLFALTVPHMALDMLWKRR